MVSVDVAAPDLACVACDFDGVDGVDSAVGEMLPFPVALFMIRENIVERYALRFDSYCQHEEMKELVDVMLIDDPAACRVRQCFG